MTVGIYEIINTTNNKRYIGSSRNTYKRIWQHQKYLKTNTHPNLHLQSAYNKYGLDYFKFKHIVTCEVKDLLFYEDSIIQGYKSNIKEFGYNLREVTESNSGMSFKYKRGDVFSRLTLIESVGESGKWLVRCSCGNEKVLIVYPLKSGAVKSCGCYNKEQASNLMKKQHSDSEWASRHRLRASVTMTKTQSRLKLNKEMNI